MSEKKKHGLQKRDGLRPHIPEIETVFDECTILAAQVSCSFLDRAIFSLKFPFNIFTQGIETCLCKFSFCGSTRVQFANLIWSDFPTQLFSIKICNGTSKRNIVLV